MLKMKPIGSCYFVFIFNSIVLIAQANDGTGPLIKTFQTVNRNMNFDGLDYKNVDDQDMVLDKFVRKTSFNFEDENNLRSSTKQPAADAPNDENVESSNAEFIKKLMKEKESAFMNTETIVNNTPTEIPDDMRGEIIKQFLLSEIQKPLVTSDNIKHEEKQKVLKDLLSNVLSSSSDNEESEKVPAVKFDEEITTMKKEDNNESRSNFGSQLVANDPNYTEDNKKSDQTENERVEKSEKETSNEENPTLNRTENEEVPNTNETLASPGITKNLEETRNQLLSLEESKVGLPDNLIDQNIEKLSKKISQLGNPILAHDLKQENSNESPQTQNNSTINGNIDKQSQKISQIEVEKKQSKDSDLTEDDRFDSNIKNDLTIVLTTMNTPLGQNNNNITPQNLDQIDDSSLENTLKIEKPNAPAQTEDNQSGGNIKNDVTNGKNLDVTANKVTQINGSSLDNDQKQDNSNDSVQKEVIRSEDNSKNDLTLDFTTTITPELDDNIDKIDHNITTIDTSNLENGIKKDTPNETQAQAEDNQLDEIRKKDNDSLNSQVSPTESGEADSNTTRVNEKDEKSETSPSHSFMESVNSEKLMAPMLMAIPTLNLNNQDPSIGEMDDPVKADAPKSLSDMTMEKMQAMSDQDILQTLEENNTINPDILEKVNKDPAVMRELLSAQDIPPNDSATDNTVQLPASHETETQTNIPVADLLTHNPFGSELPLESSPTDTRVLKSMSDAQLQAALISLLASMNPSQTNQITLQPTGYGSFLTFIGDVDLNIELVPVQSNPLTRKKAKAMFKEVSKALGKFQSKLPPGTEQVVIAVISSTVPGGSEAIQVAELVSDIVKKQKEAKKNKKNSEFD